MSILQVLFHFHLFLWSIVHEQDFINYQPICQYAGETFPCVNTCGIKRGQRGLKRYFIRVCRFLVPFRRSRRRTLVLGPVCPSVCLSVCHVTCLDFFWTSFEILRYWLYILYVAISRWVTVEVQRLFRSNDFWLSYGTWTCKLWSNFQLSTFFWHPLRYWLDILLCGYI